MGYNRLANFYNKYWTDGIPELFYKALNEYLLKHTPKNSRILDLCCGTGQMCALLKDYDIQGLDISEKMLDIARKNAPAVKFIMKDASDFSIKDFDNVPFDAVFSIFDSMNHILTKDALLKCFTCVKNVLKDGGTFLFDVNDLEVFKENWTGEFAKVEPDNVCILRPTFEELTGIASYNATTFSPSDDGSWQREDITIYERYYNDETITKLLKKAGFKSIEITDGYDKTDLAEFEGRRFVIAK